MYKIFSATDKESNVLSVAVPEKENCKRIKHI